MDTNFIVGIPAMSLLPAKDYKLIQDGNDYVIKLPKRGSFSDLILGDDQDAHMFEGDFVIYDDETQTLYTSVVTQVLFALKKYPQLSSEEGDFSLFTTKAIQTDGETVKIFGEMVTII